jgi:RNA polymerase sigma-70 factor (TIGR02943 family)
MGMDEKEKKNLSRSQPQLQWIEKYADALFNFAVVRLGDRETAKDLVQETFLSALQNLDTFRGESSEKTWLVSILKNKIIDHYRKRKTAQSVPLSDADGTSELDKYFDHEGEWKESARPVSWTGTGYHSLRSKEFLEILHKCLSKLQELGREIFMLKYLDDLDSEEICKKLDVSASNYWVIMHRAKLRLRQCIDKNWIQA